MTKSMEKTENLGKMNFFQTSFTVRAVSYAAIILNLASIVLGLVYLAMMTSYTVLWDIFGVIYLLTLFCNVLLVFLDSIRLNRLNKTGHQLSKIGYLYLSFMVLAMLGIFFGNVLYSVTYAPELTANVGAFILIYFSFFAVLSLGGAIAYLNLKYLKIGEIWDQTQSKMSSTRPTLGKMVLMGICYLVLGVGIYFVFLTLFGASLASGDINGAVGMFVAQFDLFFVFLVLCTTVILLKLKNRRASPRSYYGVAIVGLVISAILMAPLCATPYAIASADQNFTAAFGSNWQNNISASVEERYFLKTPFATPEYFLGMITTNYLVNANIKFYDAEGIQLYFDAYLPTGDRDALPGNNSVIIRIHGGGWTAGDKGLANMMQMNKYFAAQGYVVFDIQYGLVGDDWEILPTPAHVRGNFTVDDMVRHIGNFTKYLVLHANEFGANVDSVFISGGSAGGHLTCAVGLGMVSGNYSTIFGTGLNIKGIVPFYPANGHAAIFGGSDVFINPDDHLVNASSPPCLVFQGLEDGIVHPSISQDLKDAYTAAGNPDCAVLYFPFGGHAADFYFTGYYNQVFLYYMERFLYLCVNNYF